MLGLKRGLSRVFYEGRILVVESLGMKKSKTDLPVIDQAIPNKASSAFIRANKKALRLRGEVLVVRNGHLGKLSADGSFVVVKELRAPVKVNAGEVIKRSKGIAIE